MGHGNLQVPKCAACLYGKQEKMPIPGKHIKKDESGDLLKGKLEPGQLFFSDQYQSRVPGRAYTIKGESSSIKYLGGTHNSHALVIGLYWKISYSNSSTGFYV